MRDTVRGTCSSRWTSTEAARAAAAAAAAVRTSDAEVANRNTVGISGGGDGLTRPFPRRPPNPLDTMVARTEGYTCTAILWGLSIVQGPFSVAPRPTYKLRIATFFIAAVRRSRTLFDNKTNTGWSQFAQQSACNHGLSTTVLCSDTSL